MNANEQLQSAIARNLANVGKSSTIGKYIIPAGESRTHKATGVFAYVIEANGRFKMRLDGQSYVDARAGTSLKATGGAYFEWIEILNTQADAEITVVVYTGFAEYRDERLFALEPLTDFAAFDFGVADPEVPATDFLEIPERTDENVIRRKALIVSNEDPVEILYVTDKNGGAGAVVWPRSTAIIHSAGLIVLTNPAATPVSVSIGEIYWVWYPFPVVIED